MCERRLCNTVAIILGAVIVATLLALGVILLLWPAAAIFIGILLVVAIAAAIGACILVFRTANSQSGTFSDCVCRNIRLLLIGSFGTIISAAFSLSVIWLAILPIKIAAVWVVSFFAFIMFAALIAALSCIIRNKCRCRTETTTTSYNCGCRRN